MTDAVETGQTRELCEEVKLFGQPVWRTTTDEMTWFSLGESPELCVMVTHDAKPGELTDHYVTVRAWVSGVVVLTVVDGYIELEKGESVEQVAQRGMDRIEEELRALHGRLGEALKGAGLIVEVQKGLAEKIESDG